MTAAVFLGNSLRKPTAVASQAQQATFVRQLRGAFTASRCSARPMPKAATIYQKMGLAYEKKVGRALAATAKVLGARLELQPWFVFDDANGHGQAVPDFLLHTGDVTLVGEIKYTFTPTAVTKLKFLYVPLVRSTVRTQVLPIIICKTLTVESVCNISSLRYAVAINVAPQARDPSRQVPTLQWLGHGPIAY